MVSSRKLNNELAAMPELELLIAEIRNTYVSNDIVVISRSRLTELNYALVMDVHFAQYLLISLSLSLKSIAERRHHLGVSDSLSPAGKQWRTSLSSVMTLAAAHSSCSFDNIILLLTELLPMSLLIALSATRMRYSSAFHNKALRPHVSPASRAA